MKQHAAEHWLAEEAKAAQGILDVLREREMTDDAELVADTVEGETGLLEAIDAADAEIRDCDVTIEGCKAVEADLKARRQRAEARKDKLRAAIEQALMIAGISEPVKRPAGTFTLAHRPPQVVVDDESKVPSRFFVAPPPKLDKAALTEAAKSGEDIPGCHLTNGGVSLTVRRK